jgi:alkaline phosphatase
VLNTGTAPGGYNPTKGGPDPWTDGSDPVYLIADPGSAHFEHGRPDSSGTATALTTGAKTYNLAIGVDRTGTQLKTIAHTAQERGFAVGAVSSVPFSHATPAAAYAHNVTRDDFQDLSRDMLGRPSISHPDQPLPGMDVVIGTGFGVDLKVDNLQGRNFVPGNQSITAADLHAIDVANGGKYTVAVRTPGRDGGELLHEAAQSAIRQGTRLFGFFGTGSPYNHLPFRTADGGYDPTLGLYKLPTKYTPADLAENPTLAEITSAAIDVLSQNKNGFWLLMEAGDVDWANHQNNIDDSIGAVLSGDEAVKVITDWVEQHSNWSESLLIVTADHGHALVLDQPEALIPQRQQAAESAD